MHPMPLFLTAAAIQTVNNNNMEDIASGFDLGRYLNQKQGIINRRLSELLDCARLQTRLCRAMEHSLMAPGKRLRPVLCIAAAEAVSDFASKSVVQTGCAIEMIHTYSLIHDDLPAMDDDDLRRGMPTCHVKFDEATAILAGDALLTLAFQAVAECAHFGEENAEALLEAIKFISSCAGYEGMVEGQMQDLEAEGKSLDLKPLKQVHGLKTGALIKASVLCGAMLSGADDPQKSALLSYADNIGLAFQVTDDILNVMGDPELMGKAAGTDQARAKSTYPALMGTGPTRKYARQLVDNSLQAIGIFGNKAAPLAAIASYIIDRDK